MDASESAFGGARNPGWEGGRRWTFILIELLGQLADVGQDQARVECLHSQLFVEGAVDVVEDVANAPWGPALRHERVEEHAIENFDGEVTTD